MKLYLKINQIAEFEALDSLLSGNSAISHIAKNNYKPLGFNQLANYLEAYRTLAACRTQTKINN